MADQQTRNDWVDIAKALCIIAIVMMHSTLGYQKAVERRLPGSDGRLPRPDPRPSSVRAVRPLPWTRAGAGVVCVLASADRASGLFLYPLGAISASAEEGALLVVEPAAFAGSALLLIVEPYGTLWFIHLLAIFSVVAFAVRRLAQELILACAFC